jgi:phosphoribosylanthranilate isomerase
MKGLIQIAGIMDREEAAMLIKAGVHQIGFPLKLAHHKDDLTEKDAGKIIRTLSSPSSAVLITYLNKAEEILGLCLRTGVRKVQLHGNVTVLELGRLKLLA